MIKNILNVIIMFLIILCMFFSVYGVNADNSFNEISLTILNPDEDYGVYMLLPESYITFINARTGATHAIDAIYGNSKANLDYISYFDVNNVQKEIYEDNGVRYLQVKMTPVANYITFSVAPSYYNMDIKIRIRSTSKDEVIDLEPFKFSTDGKCSVRYNYPESSVITDDDVKNTGSRYLVLLGILFVVMAIVSYTDRVGNIKQKRKNF